MAVGARDYIDKLLVKNMQTKKLITMKQWSQ